MSTAENGGKGRKARTSKLPKAERDPIILEQARRIFSAQGYSQTTLESIAAASGMSLSVLRKSFAVKSALFTAVLESWPGWVVRPEPPAEGKELPPDFLTILHGFADRFLQAARQKADLFALLTHALMLPSEPEELEAARVCLHQAITPLIGLLQAGQQAGIFRRVPDTRIAAQDCFRFLLGYVLFPALPDDNVDDHPVPVLETFLNGILKMDV